MSYDPTRFIAATAADADRPRWRVEESTVIDAPLAQVWRIVRDFSAGERWLPDVIGCEIEDGSQRCAIGAVRRLTLADGRQTRERLIGLSDRGCTQELTIVESAMPARDYVATFRLAPVSDGDRCWMSWAAEFDADANHGATLINTLRQNVFRIGFDRLRTAVRSD